jgi:hypothetical protein
MAIKSNAFGRVTLTGEDAAKFKRQVTYGRPNVHAKSNVEKGVELVRAFRSNGRKLTFSVDSKNP